MPGLPPVDLHCHVDTAIHEQELTSLNAVLFAATRSLAEAAQAQGRRDLRTVWGVGCHPGLAGAHKRFDRGEFARLLDQTALVSEVGLDGGSRVPLDVQKRTFDSILTELQARPRITSIHSYRATDAVLDSLSARPIQGAVLHWWLGTAEQTRHAIELGCQFSVNAAMLGASDRFARVPLDRILTETDHPFGDRRSEQGRRPGRVADVEAAIAHAHNIAPSAVRATLWRTLDSVVRSTDVERILPRRVRLELLSLGGH
jgi:TatD DNase family protein